MLEHPESHVLAQRRRFVRQRVWLRCWAHDGAVHRYACVNELSAGGARVLTAQPPHVGCVVHLTLFAPADSPKQGVHITGRVIWRSVGRDGRGGMMGLEFDEDAEHIMKHIRSS